MSTYKCTLNEASIKKASEELKEVPSQRLGAVDTLRQWVLQQSYWLKSPTDDVFLLSFLRNAKFAQLPARKRLVQYWTSRTKYPEWFANIDTTNEVLVKCLKMGMFFFCPKPDKEGRTLMIGKMAAMDVSGKTKLDDMMRSATALIDYLMLDENLQVNGTITLEDMSHLTLKHSTFMSPDDLKKSMDVWINSYPIRYKGLHYYNVNPIFEALFAIISPLLPEKLKKRVYFHGQSMTDVYKHIDKEILPSDYLPDNYKGETVGSTQDVLEKQIKILQKPEVREYLLRLSGPDYGVILDKKPKDEDLFSESFRKLTLE